jgi:hypothetical protein
MTERRHDGRMIWVVTGAVVVALLVLAAVLAWAGG